MRIDGWIRVWFCRRIRDIVDDIHWKPPDAVDSTKQNRAKPYNYRFEREQK